MSVQIMVYLLYDVDSVFPILKLFLTHLRYWDKYGLTLMLPCIVYEIINIEWLYDFNLFTAIVMAIINILCLLIHHRFFSSVGWSA